MTRLLLCAAAAVLLAGCAPTSHSSALTAGDTPISTSPKPVEGVVIVKMDGMYVYYKNKCEKCGHVEGKVHRLLGPSKGKAIVSAFLCEKCGEAQRITIMGK
jgi:hypothetical protein